MTYCVALRLDSGMIFASDSRTNAGVDQISRFSKMRVFARDGHRVIVTLSSGNLSITQNTLNTLDQRARMGDQLGATEARDAARAQAHAQLHSQFPLIETHGRGGKVDIVQERWPRGLHGARFGAFARGIPLALLACHGTRT